MGEWIDVGGLGCSKAFSFCVACYLVPRYGFTYHQSKTNLTISAELLNIGREKVVHGQMLHSKVPSRDIMLPCVRSLTHC